MQSRRRQPQQHTRATRTGAGLKNPQLVMLQRLLVLRQHKERRLRQQLAHLRQAYQQREQQLADCRRERQQLCQQLQKLAQWRGNLLPAQASAQRERQHELYQAERQRQKQIGEWVALGQQQLAAIEAQQLLLRRNQREQEKLGMLINHESNRY